MRPTPGCFPYLLAFPSFRRGEIDRAFRRTNPSPRDISRVHNSRKTQSTCQYLSAADFQLGSVGSSELNWSSPDPMSSFTYFCDSFAGLSGADDSLRCTSWK